MLLGILSVIALSVGTVQSVTELDESERVALQDNDQAIVQVIETAPKTAFQDPDMGL